MLLSSVNRVSPRTRLDGSMGSKHKTSWTSSHPTCYLTQPAPHTCCFSNSALRSDSAKCCLHSSYEQEFVDHGCPSYLYHEEHPAWRRGSIVWTKGVWSLSRIKLFKAGFFIFLKKMFFIGLASSKHVQKAFSGQYNPIHLAETSLEGHDSETYMAQESALAKSCRLSYDFITPSHFIDLHLCKPFFEVIIWKKDHLPLGRPVWINSTQTSSSFSRAAWLTVRSRCQKHQGHPVNNINQSNPKSKTKIPLAKETL